MRNQKMKYKFKCWDCGRYFNQYDEVQEDRGEFWGTQCYETMAYCPYCGGDFDRVEEVEKAE